MKYLKIRPNKLRRLPLPLNFVRHYPKAIIEDKPDRMGIDVPGFNHKHFFPYGLYKSISSTIDFENANLDVSDDDDPQTPNG